MIVVDASAMVDLLLDRGATGRWVEGAIDGRLRAPHLIDSEFASTLRALVRRGSISTSLARKALSEFQEVRVDRVPITLLLERVWALREVMTAYDASYVALAEVLDVPLVTTDRRLARTRGHSATILAPT